MQLPLGPSPRENLSDAFLCHCFPLAIGTR